MALGDPTAEVKKIFVCLDLTDETAEKAIETGAKMIVAHHPPIFHAIKKIRLDLPQGKRFARLIKNDVAVFAAHTNLDCAKGGVNDVLAEKIGLHDVKMFGEEEFSLGRIGRLENPMTAEDFARHVKKVLNADYVRLVNAGDFPIKKVGICGGAGGDVMSKAKFFGADAFVTGDLKYHEAQNAVESKIHAIDAGHFATEFPVVHALAEMIRSECERLKYDVEVIEDTTSRDIFKIF